MQSNQSNQINAPGVNHEHTETCCGGFYDGVIGHFVEKCYYCDVWRDIADCDKCLCKVMKCSVTGELCYYNYTNEPYQPVDVCTCHSVEWEGGNVTTRCNVHKMNITLDPAPKPVSARETILRFMRLQKFFGFNRDI